MQRQVTETRNLYVTAFWPWPQRMGARRRAAATVQALGTLGQVDVLYLDQGWRNAWPDEPPVGVRNAVTVLPARAPRPGPWPGLEPGPGPGCGPGSESGPGPGSGPGSESGSGPGSESGPGPERAEPEVPEPARELRLGARRQAAAWLAEHEYDLVWCNRDLAWWTVRGLLRAPTVVDVDDLTDRLVLQQAAAEGRTGAPEIRREVAAWRRLHALLKAEVDCLVVCSALDQARLGTDQSVVVPNVFLESAPARPAADPDGRRPRILLQGDFTYRPNIVAAHRLVTGILPQVRRSLPAAQVWLAGRQTGDLDALAGPDVSVLGQVRDMAAVVAAADLVAVPLTEGSGTRIKILEAWQLERPVVSTARGAEGLAAEPGRHLLLAESDADFAAAIVAVATRPTLADRLTRAGKALVADRYGLPALLTGVATAVQTAQGRALADGAARA
ncbi:MAG TPA: glycosyltransferase [Mycobacteriales bacterium]|nr:glycosyltransferase [Mycobacteriales bacterium]